MLSGDWSATVYLCMYLSILTLTWAFNTLLLLAICKSRYHSQHHNHPTGIIGTHSSTTQRDTNLVVSGVAASSNQIKHSQLSTSAMNSSKNTTTETATGLSASSSSSPSSSLPRLANYYFILSICLSNLIAVTANPPSFILINWIYKPAFKVTSPLLSLMCLIHCSMNTFLCNLAFLHVLCSCLDTFLRLKNPRLYIDSQKTQTTFLKITAPWIVTIIQSICQFTISTKGTIDVHNSICLINDANFLILRSVISYAVPLIVCVILIVLQIIYLRYLNKISITNLHFLIKSYSNKINPSNSHNDLRNEEENDGNDEEEQLNFDKPEESAVQFTTTTSSSSSQSPPSRILSHNCPKHGLIALPIPENSAVQSTPNMPDITHHNISQESTQHLLARTGSIPRNVSSENLQSDFISHCVSNNRVSISHKTNWLKMYKIEQLSIGLNMATCIVAIGIWSPLMLASLAYKLCQESPCSINIENNRITDFEWWAFSGGLMYPCVYIMLDRHTRRCVKNLFGK